jgi:hypothetical protein
MTTNTRILVWLGLGALLAFGYSHAVELAVQAVPALRVVLAPAGITALPIGTVLFVSALLLVPKTERENAEYKWAKRAGWVLVALAWGGLVLVGVYVSMHK